MEDAEAAEAVAVTVAVTTEAIVQDDTTYVVDIGERKGKRKGRNKRGINRGGRTVEVSGQPGDYLDYLFRLEAPPGAHGSNCSSS